MKVIRARSSWLGAWFLWIAVTAISWSEGWIIGLVVIAEGADLILPREASLAVGVAVCGALVGLAQWTMLGSEVRGGGSWALATVVGWISGMTVTALGVLALSITQGSSGPDTLTGAIADVAVSGVVGLVVIGMVAVVALVMLLPGPGKKDTTAYVRWWP